LTASVTRLLGLTDRTSVRPAPAAHHVPDLTEMEKTLKRPLLGNSAVMQEARSRLLRAAASNSTVLITGEKGHGQELAAEMVHYASSRKARPFLSINCAAIPESLLESELFGYEQGAFTGAQWTNAGFLERADGGTLLSKYVAASCFQVFHFMSAGGIDETHAIAAPKSGSAPRVETDGRAACQLVGIPYDAQILPELDRRASSDGVRF